MQLNLVFVGLAFRTQSDWAFLCDSLGARAVFFDTVEAVADQAFAGVDILMVPFAGGSEFLELRQRYRANGGGHLSVAILPSADYTQCQEAFRAGADDVIAQPLSRPDFEALMKHLKGLVARSVHPDAILSLAMVEKSTIRAALHACNGQVSKTSRKLGIGRSTLYRKLELHGLVEKP